MLFLCCYTETILGSNNDHLIVFARNISGNWDIWTYNSDNQKVQQITNTPEDEINPIWLKGKKSIAYLRNGHIFTLHNGVEKQLTGNGTYRYISYAPQSNRIVLSKFEEEEAEIGFLNLSNKKEDIFFTRPHQQIHPKMAPDGKSIYFVEGYLESGIVIQELWVYEIETQKLKLLYKEEKQPFFRPDPSPDGKELVFVTSNSKTMVLSLGDLTTGKSEDLVNTRANFVDYPCWSKDGLAILYTTLINNHQKLAVYDLTVKTTRVLPIAGECMEGKW